MYDEARFNSRRKSFYARWSEMLREPTDASLGRLEGLTFGAFPDAES